MKVCFLRLAAYIKKLKGLFCVREITYITKGTCSRQIDICIEHDIVISVGFVSGCNGNLQGISKLVKPVFRI